jgi:3-oxoacyl-[acyl-carrier protein] reductase
MTVRVAVITGGAGGIGAACCRALATAGHAVVVNHHGTPDMAAGIVQEIERLGQRAMSFDADVGAEAGVEALFQAVDQTFGRIDVLVNSAGIARSEDIFETTLESWNAVLRTNLTGTFLCARAAMLRMRAQRAGRIIQIGSVVGHQGALLGHVHYGASKAGVHGFTKSLARTAAAFGVTVNAVAPGIVATDMLQATHGAAGIAALQARIPLGEISTPEDVAAAVVYLASDAARHVTGAILDVNGGMLMR